MVAVKAELFDCYLVDMCVSPHMFISQKFEEFGLKLEFDLNYIIHWLSLLYPL